MDSNSPGGMLIQPINNRVRPPLQKDAREAVLEQKAKPTLLVFQGLRQTVWIEDGPVFHRLKMENRWGWSRYWNSGWRVRYKQHHICNSYYFPTHVLLPNAEIVEICERVIFKKDRNLLVEGQPYYDQQDFTQNLMPNYQHFLDGVAPMYQYEAEDLHAFLLRQEVNRKKFAFTGNEDIDLSALTVKVLKEGVYK